MKRSHHSKHWNLGIELSVFEEMLPFLGMTLQGEILHFSEHWNLRKKLLSNMQWRRIHKFTDSIMSNSSLSDVSSKTKGGSRKSPWKLKLLCHTKVVSLQKSSI